MNIYKYAVLIFKIILNNFKIIFKDDIYTLNF